MFKRPPSQLDQFLHNPSLYLAKHIYGRHSSNPNPRSLSFFPTAPPPTPPQCPVTVVCISDTHNETPVLPPGDILIHAGDLTILGTARELQAELDWLAAQPHAHKIVIAGNHDQILDPRRDRTPHDPEFEARERKSLVWHDVIYLDNSSVELTVRKPPYSASYISSGAGYNGPKEVERVIRVFGSPLTPKGGNWAFQYPRDEASQIWHHRVPDGTDILVTHGPPKAHADMAGIGCAGLLAETCRVRPALSVFGHVHAARGVEMLRYDGVQRRWEEVVEGRGGWLALARLTWEVVLAWFLWTGLGMMMMMGMRTVREMRERSKTVLVNAAHVGGMRDELRRDAITVVI